MPLFVRREYVRNGVLYALTLARRQIGKVVDTRESDRRGYGVGRDENAARANAVTRIAPFAACSRPCPDILGTE